MRFDLYTKAVLTIIAVMLTVIASSQFVNPRVANAQTSFAGVQFVNMGQPSFFDTRTGEIWAYSFSTARPLSKFRLTKLGQPLAVEKP